MTPQDSAAAAADIVRRPKATQIYELERYMRCKDCSEVSGYAYKRSHLVALRTTKNFSERSTIDVVAGVSSEAIAISIQSVH